MSIPSPYACRRKCQAASLSFFICRSSHRKFLGLVRSRVFCRDLSRPWYHHPRSTVTPRLAHFSALHTHQHSLLQAVPDLAVTFTFPALCLGLAGPQSPESAMVCELL